MESSARWAYFFAFLTGPLITLVTEMVSARGPLVLRTTFFAAFFTAFLVTFFVAFFAAAGFFFAAFFFAMVHDSCRTFDGRPIADGDRG